MFVRAASRRVSGLTSRLTGRGLVVAAARFSGANGDDHVRRDPQVEFFGGDESEAPFAAAAGGAAGAGAGRAPGGTRGGGGGAPTSGPNAQRQAGVRPPAPEYRTATGGRPGASSGGSSAASAARPGGGLYAPKPPPRQTSAPRASPPPPAPPPPSPPSQRSPSPTVSRPTPPPAPIDDAVPPPPPPPRAPDRSPVALRDVLLQKAIVLQSYTPGQHRIVCPSCGGGSNGERSLAVHIEADGREAQWMCHRATCEWTGGSSVADAKSISRRTQSESAMGSNTSVGTGMSSRRPGAGAGGAVKLPTPESLERVGPGETTPAAKKWGAWLESRGIDLAVAERNGLASQNVFSPPAGAHVDALVFPYMRDGELVNIKYRGEDKSFWQVKGAEKILFGLDDIAGAREIVIVEGEMDKLALEQAGVKNVVSVPDGAPGKVKDGPVPAPEEDRKFEYLWNCRAALDPVSRVVIAADADAPGQALAEELARRLGKERCFRVHWPEGCKDANDVLLKEGEAALRGAIDNAEGFPLRGLFRFSDFEDDIANYFGVEESSEMKGVSTGWKSIDNHYRVVPGELTVITGVPNSGKSEWVDALMCNLAVQHGWTFALCSMENKVHEHARKLVEKYTGEPWFEGKYTKKARMRPETMRQGLHWLDNQFVLIRHEDDELPSVDWIIGLARAAVMRHGIRGLLIDPYNELDHKRPQGQTETEYVSQMLTRIKKFAQHYDVHVWFVAHPRQLHNWRGEAPGLYDISGSAHFINKCDNGIVVHRNRDEKAGSLREVTVMVAKVRNKVAGSIGDPKLEYNLSNGRYEDIQ